MPIYWYVFDMSEPETRIYECGYPPLSEMLRGYVHGDC